MRSKNNLTLYQTIRNTRNVITDKYGIKVSRSLHVTGAIGVANIAISLGKLLLGILSLSFFTCVNAFYSFGMVIAKYCSLVGIIKAKNKKEQNHTPLIHGIKMISLASSLISLVLTQTAILSFTSYEGDEVHSMANGLIGVIMGGIATVIGIAMILRIRRIEKSEVIENIENRRIY